MYYVLSTGERPSMEFNVGSERGNVQQRRAFGWRLASFPVNVNEAGAERTVGRYHFARVLPEWRRRPSNRRERRVNSV